MGNTRDLFKSLMSPGSPFHDFPIQDRFLFQMDGWQTSKGPHFKATFYNGMDRALVWIAKFLFENREFKAEDLNELHKVAYPSREEDIESTNIFGFRDKQNCAFAISRAGEKPEQKNEIKSTHFEDWAEGAVSTAGAPEFVEAWIKAQDGYEDDSRAPRWILTDTRGDIIKLHSDEDLLQKLPLHAERFDYSWRKVYIQTDYELAIESKLIHNYIAKRLSTLYRVAAERKDSAIIQIEIIDLIRDLHQSHVFSDGNGRTLVLLLQNILLFQLTGHWARIETPFHFAGFSKKELDEEISTGIKNFETCKITQAKQFILEQKTLSPDDNLLLFKSKLKEKIASDTTIALAQLNEIFFQIESKEINLSHYSAESISRLMIILKELYIEKLSEVLLDEKNTLFCKEYLHHLNKNHEIVKALPGLNQLIDAYILQKKNEHIAASQKFTEALKLTQETKSPLIYQFYLDRMSSLKSKLEDEISHFYFPERSQYFENFKALRLMMNSLQENYIENSNEHIKKIMLSFYDFLNIKATESGDLEFADYGVFYIREALNFLSNKLKNVISEDERLARINQCKIDIKRKIQDFFSQEKLQEMTERNIIWHLREYFDSFDFRFTVVKLPDDKILDHIEDFINLTIFQEPVFALFQLNALYFRLDDKLPAVPSSLRDNLKERIKKIYQSNFDKLDPEYLESTYKDQIKRQGLYSMIPSQFDEDSKSILAEVKVTKVKQTVFSLSDDDSKHENELDDLKKLISDTDFWNSQKTSVDDDSAKALLNGLQDMDSFYDIRVRLMLAKQLYGDSQCSSLLLQFVEAIIRNSTLEKLLEDHQFKNVNEVWKQKRLLFR